MPIDQKLYLANFLKPLGHFGLEPYTFLDVLPFLHIIEANALFIAIPLSPVFAMVAYAAYGVVAKIFEWLGKSKPKDGWWKDTGGY